MTEVRTVHPVTFFDGNVVPHGVTDFSPRPTNPDALFEMAEPSPADLATVESIAEASLTENPEAGITTPADDDEQVPGQMVLPLGLGDKAEAASSEAAPTGRSGKVPPA